jgi:hypothetical protein
MMPYTYTISTKKFRSETRRTWEKSFYPSGYRLGRLGKDDPKFDLASNNIYTGPGIHTVSTLSTVFNVYSTIIDLIDPAAK